MIKYRFLKILCFVYISVLLLSGCTKADNRNTAETTAPTTIPNIKSSPSINPTIGTSNSSQSEGTLNDTEDNLMKEEPTNEIINHELCSEDEDILISFNIADSDKTAAICISKLNSEYIIYRYGKPNDIELEYPDKKDDTWDKFTYSYYLRGGGTDNAGMDLNYLYFENGDYKYEIYEEYDSESDASTVGITVTNLKTGDVTDIPGDNNSIHGSLINLRDNNKINLTTQ